MLKAILREVVEKRAITTTATASIQLAALDPTKKSGLDSVAAVCMQPIVRTMIVHMSIMSG